MFNDTKTPLIIKCPILVNWDQDLIPANSRFFKDWKIRYEGGRQISYPRAARSDKPLLWILSLDALFFEFNQTHFTNKWALPLHPIVRAVRAQGFFLPERKITAGEMRELATQVRPDNPDFNTCQMLEETLAAKQDDEFLTEKDMVEFQCLKKWLFSKICG
jgi:hypothetical protein